MKSKLSQILIAGAIAAVLLLNESDQAISPVLALYTIVNNILEQKQFKAHQGSISSVSFSPDGKLLATAGNDGTAKLWNLSGQQLAQFNSHQRPVLSVSFSPDGKLLATVGDDGTVNLLHVAQN